MDNDKQKALIEKEIKCESIECGVRGMNNNITPENLKLLAEDMYPEEIEHNTFFDYNPHENAKQCLEVEIKYKITSDPDKDSGLWEAWIYHESDEKLDIGCIGETPLIARTKAAIAYVKRLER